MLKMRGEYQILHESVCRWQQLVGLICGSTYLDFGSQVTPLNDVLFRHSNVSTLRKSVWNPQTQHISHAEVSLREEGWSIQFQHSFTYSTYTYKHWYTAYVGPGRLFLVLLNEFESPWICLVPAVFGDLWGRGVTATGDVSHRWPVWQRAAGDDSDVQARALSRCVAQTATRKHHKHKDRLRHTIVLQTGGALVFWPLQQLDTAQNSRLLLSIYKRLQKGPTVVWPLHYSVTVKCVLRCVSESCC